MRPPTIDATRRTPIRLDADRAVRHLDQLYRYATAITGDRREAEDLVHDVFESLLRRPRPLHAHDNERAYLFAMVRHRHIDTIRARRRRPPVALEPAGSEEAARAGEAPAARAEQREVLDAVARLDPAYRDALVAIDVVGLRYGEAADLLGVPLGTVMSRVHRARARVVAALDEPPVSRAAAGPPLLA